MKKFRLALFALAFFAFGATFVSCEKNGDVKPSIEKTEDFNYTTNYDTAPKKKRKKR